MKTWIMWPPHRARLPTLEIAVLAVMSGGCVDDAPVPVFVTVTHTGAVYDAKDAGAFGSAPITSGQAFETEFRAAAGDRLFLATMLTASNDTFLAPDPTGIAVHDAGAPISAEVTSALSWWDAGTEADEDLGLGAHQAARQTTPGAGDPDPDPSVRAASDPSLPDVADAVRVDVTHVAGTTFRLRVAVVGTTFTARDESLHDLALGPGVFAVRSAPGALFTPDGLAPFVHDVVEDMDPAPFVASTPVGITVPLGHPFYVVTHDEEALFAEGAPDFGEGLEALAEDGAAAGLAQTWADRDVTSWGFVNTPSGTGTYTPGPALPGQAFLLQLQARPRDRLHVAWMYAESNDVLFSVPPEGVELVDGRGRIVTGRVRDVALWDAGTEENQPPGWGADQPMRQVGADTGADEGGVVRPVDDGFDYGRPGDLVRLDVLVEAPAHLLPPAAE